MGRFVKVSIGCALIYLFALSSPAKAQISSGDPIEAIITEITFSKNDYGVTETKITLASKGEVITIDSQVFTDTQLYSVGDKVLIVSENTLSGDEYYYIVDHDRRGSLLLLWSMFVILVVLVSRMWGIRSLLGLGVSFFVIFWYVLPEIGKGANPVVTSILGSLAVLLTTFYLSHGINPKTHLALAGTFVSLVLTAGISLLFIKLANLSGYASEEAIFLSATNGVEYNIKGLLLAGIIFSVLGVLDDITISQASVVAALHNANPKYKFKQLFVEAMKVGHDHIASLINTLILVYAGSSLPLLLLFYRSDIPYSMIINYEIVAEEIVKALIGSSALILAVPITTLVAAYGYPKLKSKRRT